MSILPIEGKIVANHSPPAPSLMVHKPKSAAEKNMSDIRQFIKQGRALLMTLISGERKNTTGAEHVVLKKTHETSILVSTQAAGLIKVICNENVAKHFACVMDKEITDDYPVYPFYITIASFGNMDVHFPKRKR